MKELKNFKEPKKKPGQFKKSKKKFQNIQHNRNQLKLLKDQVADHAELFVLEHDGFYKVIIKSFPEIPYDAYGRMEYIPVVYLSQGKRARLRISHLIGKDAYPRCKVDGGGFIPWKHCFGIITSKELLSSKKPAGTVAPID